MHRNLSENILHQLACRWFWRASNYVATPDVLGEGQGVTSRQNVSGLISGEGGAAYPLTVTELAGGKIIGDLRLVATRDDVVVGGIQSIFGCAEPQNHYLLRRRRFRIPKYRHGTALLMGAANSDNYYHWLLDSLPRWKILQPPAGRTMITSCCTACLASFRMKPSTGWGVPPEKRLRCSKNFVHQFERLVVPAMPFPVEEVPPGRARGCARCFPEKISGPEKIYLSRRDSGRRQLVNEAELQAALTSRGFVTIQPDQLSVANRQNFLVRPDALLPPHGAALTNLVFSRRVRFWWNFFIRNIRIAACKFGGGVRTSLRQPGRTRHQSCR